MEEIKVNPKKKKSSKGKITLSIVSIFLACVFLFGASFILSLGYLINPTPIVFGQGKTSADLEKENQELKDEIELLESQIERLEASVETYKNSALAKEEPEPETTTETAVEPEATTTAPTSTGQSLHSQRAEAAEKKQDKKTETKKEDTTTKFEAETTVTPKDDKELSEPASEDITVVEID